MAEHKSIPVTIPATKAHRKFGELIRRVYSGEEHFVVEKDGLPVAAIISMEEYRQFMAKQAENISRFENAARQIGEEIARQELTEEDIEAQVESVRQRLHNERHAR